MKATVTLEYFTNEHQDWLVKNVGSRLHYISNRSIGGQGWVCKREYGVWNGLNIPVWKLTFEDGKNATWFVLTHDL